MKPMLNLGCGRIILPCEKPYHHMLVNDDIYEYPSWVNADKNPEPGVDKVIDLFRYPWDLEDNAYSGALISHVCEHIPHDIRTQEYITDNPSYESTSQLVDTLTPSIGRNDPLRFQPHKGIVNYGLRKRVLELEQMQDGWFAFFSELWRVLEHGAMVHIIGPYGKSDDAISDPTHTRFLNEFHFRHSMQPNPDAPFKYNHQLHFEVMPDDRYRATPYFAREPYFVDGQPTDAFEWAKLTQWNVVQDFYVRMKAVKR